MSWPLIFGIAWFGALGLIWAFIHGAAILRDAENTRARCIPRYPDRRKRVYNYRSVRP